MSEINRCVHAKTARDMLILARECSTETMASYSSHTRVMIGSLRCAVKSPQAWRLDLSLCWAHLESQAKGGRGTIFVMYFFNMNILVLHFRPLTGFLGCASPRTLCLNLCVTDPELEHLQIRYLLGRGV